MNGSECSLPKKKLSEARAHLRNARPGTFLAWMRLSEIDPKGLDEVALNQLLDEWNQYTKA